MEVHKKTKKRSKSKLFEITDIKKISLSDADYGYSYSDSTLRNLLKPYKEVEKEAELTLCFIDYPLDDNCFFRRLTPTIGVATFYETDIIFKNANVDLKNFILLRIFIFITLYL